MARARSFLKTRYLLLAAIPVLAITVIGWAHTPAGRPWLAAMSPGSEHASAKRGGVCPFGFGTPQSAAQRDASQRRFAALHAGSGQARQRPAAGFALASTTRGALLDWARQAHVDCHAKPKGGDVECLSIPVGLLPGGDARSPEVFETAWLGFDGNDRLSSVIVVQRAQDAHAAWQAFESEIGRVAETSGKPAVRTGEASSAGLGAGLLRQSGGEFRFADYYALVRVTNMGANYLLSREYRALPTSG